MNQAVKAVYDMSKDIHEQILRDSMTTIKVDMSDHIKNLEKTIGLNDFRFNPFK